MIKKKQDSFTASLLWSPFGVLLSLIPPLLKSNLFWFFFAIAAGFGLYSTFDFKRSKLTDDFRIEKIEFDGYERIPEILLLKASGLKYKSNVFAVSINDVKEKLEQISWIKSVSVQRKLPNKFSIRVTERVPIAILQRNYKLHLLDEDGKVLEHDGIGSFGNLPIVVGEGAEKAVKHLLFVLDKNPKVRNQLAFATFIGRRRWNITINKGITVKLPEKNLGYAMKILGEISDDNGFFNKDIKEIDLRLPDRVIVRKEALVEKKEQ